MLPDRVCLSEFRDIDIDRAVAAARRGLGQSHRAECRLAEHGAGDKVVVEGLRRRRTEQVAGEPHALAQRDGGQLHPVDHVADSTDRGHGGAELPIHDDGATRGQFDAGFIQPQARGVGDAARRVENKIGGDLGAVVQFGAEIATALLDAFDRGVEPDLDALLAHLVTQEMPQIVVEAAQEVRAPVELRDLRAQALHDAGELDRDITAADHDDAFRELLQIEHVVGDRSMFTAPDVGHEGLAAGGNQDMVRGDGLAPDLHRVRPHHGGAGLVDRHPGIAQDPLVDAVQALDLGALVGDQRFPVEAVLAHRPAEAGGVREFLGEMRGIDEQLLRHAADIDAGAAEEPVLRDADARAQLCRDTRRPHPGRAGANDEEVVVVVSHQSLPRVLSGRSHRTGHALPAHRQQRADECHLDQDRQGYD
jgi:hypothetical protein